VESQINIHSEEGILDISDFHIVKATGGLQKDMQTVFIWDEAVKHYIYVHFSVDLEQFNVYMLKERCQEDIDLFMRRKQAQLASDSSLLKSQMMPSDSSNQIDSSKKQLAQSMHSGGLGAKSLIKRYNNSEMPKFAIGRITEISYSKVQNQDQSKNFLDVDIDIVQISEN